MPAGGSSATASRWGEGTPEAMALLVDLQIAEGWTPTAWQAPSWDAASIFGPRPSQRPDLLHVSACVRTKLFRPLDEADSRRRSYLGCFEGWIHPKKLASSVLVHAKRSEV